MHLRGKNIVITGGTSGIGYELVKRLHADNALIVIASHADRLERLAAQFSGVQTCRADLSDPDALESAAHAINTSVDNLDVLVNNAAVQYTPGFLDADFDPASIGREIAINLTAVCSLTALLLPALLREGPAAIVNVNSGLAIAPKTSSAVYCATKGGVNLFSQSLRYQLATTEVAVLQVFLPLVETPMTHGRGDRKLSAADAAERILSGIERGIEDHYIGKAKLLRALALVAPGLARRIMRRS